MKRNITIQLWSTLMCFLLAATPVYADGTGGPDFVPASTHDPSIQSPQVAAMIRHDNVPVDLSTGGIDLKIPLVEWKDNDFECPVSLSYNSSGFRPREQDNFVGRNWMLNVGGVIYRRVNGVPDDMDYFDVPLAAEGGQSVRVCGFLNMLNKNRFKPDEMEKSYRTNPYQYARYKDKDACLPIIPGMTKDIESSADIFYFSFGKHSGKFMINFDGTVSVSGNNGGKYKVDLSKMKILNSTKITDTRIRIMTDDGYIYTFGGGYSSLEYNALSWKDFFYNGNTSPNYFLNEINAFYLTEIKSPDGRIMTFKYRDKLTEVRHTAPYSMNELQYKSYDECEEEVKQYSLSGISKYQAYRMAPSTYYASNDVLGPEILPTYALTKIALLERIETNGFSINFYYSGREKHIDYTGKASDKDCFPYICGAKLDRMEVWAGRDYKVDFAYTYQCGNRMFLSSVKAWEGTYKFQYKADANISYPSPLTYNIDHWGFWRGRQDNSGIIPGMERGDDYDMHYTITTDDRNATGKDFDYTLLQKVTYPTGGYTLFNYEPHRYSQSPVKVRTSQFYPNLKYPEGQQSATAGGARIHSVTHYDRNVAVKKTIYTYGYKLSEGEIMYMPYYRYLAYFRNDRTGQQVIDYISFDSEGIADVPSPSVHIRYPQVTEHFIDPSTDNLNEKHPYKVTDFIGPIGSTSNYVDDFSYPTCPELLNTEYHFGSSEIKLYNRNLLAHPTIDATLKYGKIKRESYYNADRLPILQTEYEYKYLNTKKYGLRFYSPAPHFGLRTGWYTHAIKEPFYEFSPVSKKTTRYTPGKPGEAQESKEWYAYDNDGYLAEDITLNANADSLINRYGRRYFNNPEGMQILPVGHHQLISTPQGERLLKRDTIVYARIDPTYINGWYIPWRFASYDNEGLLQSQKEVIRHDIYGNPIETITNGMQRTIYLWDLQGRRMVAKIENATYSEVCEALGCTPEYLSEMYNSKSTVTGIHAKLPDARIHTFYFSDGLGMLEQTPPSGQTIHYWYDQDGKLKRTYRTNEKGKTEILQLYDYHVINE